MGSPGLDFDEWTGLSTPTLLSFKPDGPAFLFRLTEVRLSFEAFVAVVLSAPRFALVPTFFPSAAVFASSGNERGRSTSAGSIGGGRDCAPFAAFFKGGGRWFTFAILRPSDVSVNVVGRGCDSTC
jgi:hypothetical protein